MDSIRYAAIYYYGNVELFADEYFSKLPISGTTKRLIWKGRFEPPLKSDNPFVKELSIIFLGVVHGLNDRLYCADSIPQRLESVASRFATMEIFDV